MWGRLEPAANVPMNGRRSGAVLSLGVAAGALSFWLTLTVLERGLATMFNTLFP